MIDGKGGEASGIHDRLHLPPFVLGTLSVLIPKAGKLEGRCFFGVSPHSWWVSYRLGVFVVLGSSFQLVGRQRSVRSSGRAAPGVCCNNGSITES